MPTSHLSCNSHLESDVFSKISITPGIVLAQGRSGLYYFNSLNLLKGAKDGEDLFVVLHKQMRILKVGIFCF